MSSAQPDSAALKLYGNAAAAALLWHFRLHPRPISSREEGVPDPAQGEIPFGAMVSYRVTSLPDTVANGAGALAGAALGHARKGMRVRFEV